MTKNIFEPKKGGNDQVLKYSQGSTALMIAIKHKDIATISKLVESGANLDIRDTQVKTFLLHSFFVLVGSAQSADFFFSPPLFAALLEEREGEQSVSRVFLRRKKQKKYYRVRWLWILRLRIARIRKMEKKSFHFYLKMVLSRLSVPSIFLTAWP